MELYESQNAELKTTKYLKYLTQFIPTLISQSSDLRFWRALQSSNIGDILNSRLPFPSETVYTGKMSSANIVTQVFLNHFPGGKSIPEQKSLSSRIVSVFPKQGAPFRTKSLLLCNWVPTWGAILQYLFCLISSHCQALTYNPWMWPSFMACQALSQHSALSFFMIQKLLPPCVFCFCFYFPSHLHYYSTLLIRFTDKHYSPCR